MTRALVLFTIWYILILSLGTALLVLGIIPKANTGLSIGMAGGAAILAGQSFASVRQRPPTGYEIVFMSVICTMVATIISILIIFPSFYLQALLAGVSFNEMIAPLREVPVWGWFMASLFIFPLYFLLFVVIYGPLLRMILRKGRHGHNRARDSDA